ncbi:polymer-forming cytoskeletal protein [Candidatus Omnitrophota bacterium]
MMAFRGGKASKDTLQNEKSIEINAQMQGSLVFKDPVNLKINGNFSGSLETKGTLTIGGKSEVEANITGDSIIIAGKVKGDITANTMLVLMPTATLSGNIHIRKLNIVEGAQFEGNCSMDVAQKKTENLLDIEEVSRYLEININEIEDLANSGKIPGIREGNSWKFEQNKIDHWATSGKVK